MIGVFGCFGMAESMTQRSVVHTTFGITEKEC